MLFLNYSTLSAVRHDSCTVNISLIEWSCELIAPGSWITQLVLIPGLQTPCLTSEAEMLSLGDSAPPSCCFSTHWTPIRLVSFLLFMPVPSGGFVFACTASISVFFPVVPHSSFFVSLLLSLPLIYPHIFDVQISKSPIRYFLLGEAISGISWDYLTPFDLFFFLAFVLFCFHVLFLFPICEPDSEPVKAQPRMFTAPSLYPWCSTPSSHLLPKNPPRV